MGQIIPFPVIATTQQALRCGPANVFRLATARARRLRRQRAEKLRCDREREVLLDVLREMEQMTANGSIAGLIFIIHRTGGELAAGAVGAPYRSGRNFNLGSVRAALQDIHKQL